MRLLPLLLLLVLLATLAPPVPADAQSPRQRLYLPHVPRDPIPTPTPTPTPSPTPQPGCQQVVGTSYSLIPVDGPPTDRPAEVHPDINLAIRGWQSVGESRSLVDYSGGTDPNAPQLYGLFSNRRTPSFTSTHRVYDWDWANMRRGGPITSWPVTLLGMATTPGERIHVPERPPGTDIYQGVFHALVLYATDQRITLKYTREDNIVRGYGVHVENVCVDPRLVALYESANRAGRGELPALASGQAFGHARSGEIMVAVRDTGSFMDPRARKDWWSGRLAQ